jgi:hypothetical protein
LNPKVDNQQLEVREIGSFLTIKKTVSRSFAAMKKAIQLLAIIVACCFGTESNAQEWTKSMTDGSSIYEAKQAFDNHWGDQSYIKGRGYKQFQRWFNFWEPRLYPSGEWDQLDSQSYLDAVRFAEPNANRDGGNWESLGLDDWSASSYGPGNGRINCIAFDPNDDQSIYAGTPSGGLWHSPNNGQDWTPLTDHLPTLGVSGIVVSEDDADVIYIATGDSDNSDTYSLGIFKSTDGGDTWETAGLTFL